MSNLDKIQDDYRYILVDGSNMAKWYYHSPAPLTSHDGHPTSILYGCLNYVITTKKDHPNAKIIFCWEGNHYSVRKSANKAYKQNRTRDADYEGLLIELQDTLPLVGAYQCFQPGLEADDIIGFFATQRKGRKLIVSRDRDLWQHVGPDVDIDLRSSRNPKALSGIQTEDTLSEYLGYPVKNIVMHKILKGDTSDEVKGILRFPNALAIDLCQRASTLSDLKHCIQTESWEPKFEKWKQVMKENWDKLEENNYLIRFHPEWVDLTKAIKTSPSKNRKLLLKILNHRSMFSLIKRLK